MSHKLKSIGQSFSLSINTDEKLVFGFMSKHIRSWNVYQDEAVFEIATMLGAYLQNKKALDAAIKDKWADALQAFAAAQFGGRADRRRFTSAIRPVQELIDQFGMQGGVDMVTMTLLPNFGANLQITQTITRRQPGLVPALMKLNSHGFPGFVKKHGILNVIQTIVNCGSAEDFSYVADHWPLVVGWLNDTNVDIQNQTKALVDLFRPGQNEPLGFAMA
jgi:hypothetical protein